MMDMDTAPQSVQDRQRNMNTLKKCRGKNRCRDDRKERCEKVGRSLSVQMRMTLAWSQRLGRQMGEKEEEEEGNVGDTSPDKQLRVI